MMLKIWPLFNNFIIFYSNNFLTFRKIYVKNKTATLTILSFFIRIIFLLLEKLIMLKIRPLLSQFYHFLFE